MVNTRRTRQPKTSKPLAKTKPTPLKTATIAETKKGGRHPDKESVYDHLEDLCKYRDLHGTTKVPRSDAGLGNWVHYIRKRKVQGVI
jgi:hypothetical protein